MKFIKNLFGSNDDAKNEMIEFADSVVIDVIRVDGAIECYWLLSGLSRDELRMKFKNADAMTLFVDVIEKRIKKKDYLELETVNFDTVTGKTQALGFITRAIVDDANNVIFNWKKDVTYSAEDYINGNYGKAVVELMSPLAKHFLGLTGWEHVELDLQELVWLATVVAHINLTDEQAKNKLTDTQISAICTGIAMRYAQIEYGKQFTNELLQLLLSRYNVRYKEYKELWTRALETKEIGAFSTHAFEQVQDGDVTSLGYVEHYTTFAALVNELCQQLNNVDVLS